MEQTQVQSPAVGSDGTIYIGTGMTDTSLQSNGVYAINPDGTQKWKLTLGKSVHSSIALDQQENLYFIVGDANDPDSMNAALYSLDSLGRLRWTFDSIGWMAPIPNTGFTPAIAADGTIYANGRYSLFAVKPDGTMKWKYDFPLIDNVFSSGERHTAGSHRSAPTIAADGTVYVNTERGGHDPTGNVDGGVYALGTEGNLKWRTYDVGGTAAPVIDKDGTIYSAVGGYGPSDTAKLLAIHPDGTPKWSVLTELWIEASPSIGADGTLYAGTTHHPLDVPAWFYAISPEGQIKWKYDTYDDVKDLPPAQTNPPDIYNSPAVDADGNVYFGNEVGLFYCLTSDGNVAWRDNGPSIMYGSPAIVEDGTLYFGSHTQVSVGHFGLIALSTGSHGLASSPWPKFRKNNANTGCVQESGPSGAVEHLAEPKLCELYPNYPNPFNPTTVITFQLSGNSWVRLAVYDLLGREVAVLVNERKAPGGYEITFDASRLASGVYFYRLQTRQTDGGLAGSFAKTRSLVVMR